MSDRGEVSVIEINPLPGITPGYSDLVQIATAAGMDYRTLVGEILAGALRRLREKRRRDRVLSQRPGAPPPGASPDDLPAMPAPLGEGSTDSSISLPVERS